MRSNLNKSDVLSIGTIIAASCLLIIPIVAFGIPDNYDLSQHLRFAQTYYETLSSGSFSPVWAASDNFGYGSVGIRFYPPLTYLVLGFIQFFTDSWYDSLWISIAFWMIASGVGTYIFARQFLNWSYSLLAALIYLIAPYHLVQIYQAFLLAEFTASAILPFCFLFAYRLLKDLKWSDAIFFAISFSLLILAHIPSTIIGSISLGIFVLVMVEKKSVVNAAIRFTIAGLLSLCLSSFYWVRLITEMEWVQHNSKQFYGEGFYNYSAYLFPMFVNGGEIYIQRFLWLWDIIVVLSFLLILPGFILLITAGLRKTFQNRTFIALFCVTLFAFFILSSASTFIWDNIASLQKIQFPWRWLAASTFTGAVIFSISVADLSQKYVKAKKIILYAIGLFCFVLIIFNITQVIAPSAPLSRQDFNQKLINIHQEAGCACWWPIWANKTSFAEKQQVSPSDRLGLISEWSPTKRVFSVTYGVPVNIRIATFYYPYWKATVNGADVPIEKADDGSMLIPGVIANSEITINFAEPTTILIFKYFSIISSLALIFGLLIFVIKKSRRTVNG